MTLICIHLELFGGSAWQGDAVQDLYLIRLFAGIGSYNVHIQTFPAHDENAGSKQGNQRSCSNTLHNAQNLNPWHLATFDTSNSEAKLHPTANNAHIAVLHLDLNAETKLRSIRICLGNFASRCDLAMKPKNGISCCSFSDKPSVMTWAVVP